MNPPIARFSSRRGSLYDTFLADRLTGAVRYDRIAGYFQSSLLSLAAGEMASIRHVRIVCNTDVNPADVQALRQALGPRREELEKSLLRMVWNRGDFPHLVDVHGDRAKRRLRVLQDLVTPDPATGRTFEIRIVPDCEFGFLHGKAGVIRYDDASATSFMGSANDSRRAWSKNYELIWEDSAAESVAWVQEEFDALWARGFPISEYIVRQIGRLGQRTILEHVGEWRRDPKLEKVLAEVPTCTELFGFWDHQKYFIKMAFDEHRRYESCPGRGARYLLADGVGLGKTLQLGGLAKLIGTLSDRPILIVAPKAVVSQWQGEIYDKLAAPSAVWTGRGWLTERGEFHPATEETVTKCPRKIAIVATSVVLSASRSVLNGRLADELLRQKFSCVLWDEAHKIRRENLQEPKVWGPPQMNLLYQWAMRLAAQTQSMILATATPVQLHPVELWDLLNVLAVDNDQVLGSAYGRWSRAEEPLTFDLLAGRESIDGAFDKWTYFKDPLPRIEQHEVFGQVRGTLDLCDTDDRATDADFEALDPLDQEDLERLEVREINPFTTRVIKRSRERLERDGKLVPIELVAVDDERPVVATHAIEQALDLAEELATALNERTTASGFIKTLLQRRVGSSVIAGWKTASRMLEHAEVDDEELDETGAGASDGSIYPLTDAERDSLERLRDHLQRQLDRDGDPKFDRVAEILQREFDGATWLTRGVLIFSQFYDSAFALCESLAGKMDDSIGLYANSSSSKLFENGKVQTVDRELLKEKVRVGSLKVLVGTDAASTGLNLQTLGSLINLDLPWNPTTLEQRKGRVQRGTIAKRIPYCNLRYSEGVEQRLFNVLTGRIREITDIFGTIPDFITDDWINQMAAGKRISEQELVQKVTGRSRSPFSVNETYEYLDDEWESTVEVLNSREAIEVFLKGW